MVLQSGVIGQGDDDSDEGENEIFEEQPKGKLIKIVKFFVNYQSTIEIVKINPMKINHPLRPIYPAVRIKESMLTIPLSWKAS
jgi:hypothetical protein